MLEFSIVIFILLGTSSFYGVIFKHKKKKFLLFSFLLLLLWFMSAFRYGDKDYGNYVEAFYHSDGYMEPGYLFFNRIIRFFGGNVEVFFASFAFGSISLMGRFIYKYNKYIIVGLLVYFSHVFILREMLQIRAGFAIAGCMLSIPYIYERKLLKTLLIVFLMSSFHFIAIFWLLVYFLYPYLLTQRRIVLLVLLGLLMGELLNQKAFEVILQFTKFRLLYVYLANKDYSYALGLLNPVLIKQLIVLILLLIKFKFFEERIPYFKVLIVSYAIACFWLSTFNFFAIFAARIATLFSNVEHILIPSFLFLKYKLLVLLLIVIYCIIAFYDKIDLLEKISFVFSI